MNKRVFTSDIRCDGSAGSLVTFGVATVVDLRSRVAGARKGQVSPTWHHLSFNSTQLNSRLRQRTQTPWRLSGPARSCPRPCNPTCASPHRSSTTSCPCSYPRTRRCCKACSAPPPRRQRWGSARLGTTGSWGTRTRGGSLRSLRSVCSLVGWGRVGVRWEGGESQWAGLGRGEDGMDDVPVKASASAAASAALAEVAPKRMATTKKVKSLVFMVGA